MHKITRESHLDLLRAMAIVAVVAYHVIQMCPAPLPRLMWVASAGQYGVDLFFVLSGWLIGGLYWKEHRDFGQVDIVRFWLRRWMRTVPPYLFALVLSWLAVRIHRGEPFDWGYLVFIQNYYSRLPYFLVSWSLCIEEHFYLFLPLLLVLPVRRTPSLAAFFGTLVLVAPACRWWMSIDGIDTAFGFEHTATHLRMEGLLLGFWLAHIRNSNQAAWSRITGAAPWILCSALAGLIVVHIAGDLWMQRIGLTVLALGLAGLLVCVIDRRPGVIVSSPWVKGVALASYSVYLTHPLLIHVARNLMERQPALPWPLYFPLVIGLVTAGGALFYKAVEQPSIVLRDRWVPRRQLGK